MKTPRIIRAAAAALALTAAPALAADRAPAHPHAAASHEHARHDCPCHARQDAKAARGVDPEGAKVEAMARAAEEAFVQRVWNSP